MLCRGYIMILKHVYYFYYNCVTSYGSQGQHYNDRTLKQNLAEKINTDVV